VSKKWMDSIEAHLWGGPPGPQAEALVGRYWMAAIVQTIAEAGRGPAADQGVRPTNPSAQLILGHYTR